jgi:hypothetical protein
LPKQVIGVTNLMSLVLLIGPHVLRKVQVRDALPLTLRNLDAWKSESSLGKTKVVADGAARGCCP